MGRISKDLDLVRRNCNPRMQPAVSVATSRDLLHVLEQMEASEFVALDTEFMRESTYYARLCLIQAATSDGSPWAG